MHSCKQTIGPYGRATMTCVRCKHYSTKDGWGLDGKTDYHYCALMPGKTLYSSCTPASCPRKNRSVVEVDFT